MERKSKIFVVLFSVVCVARSQDKNNKNGLFVVVVRNCSGRKATDIATTTTQAPPHPHTRTWGQHHVICISTRDFGAARKPK